MPTIALARVHGNMVDPLFFEHYEQLVEYTRFKAGIQVLPAVVSRLHVDRARNEIVDMVLNPEKPRLPQYPNGVMKGYKQCSHIMFVDDDMILPPNAIEQLLRHNLPVVGGLYFGRNPPHLPIVYRHVEGNQWIPVTEFCAGLQEVDAIGAGCLLIRRDVLEAMERPWFEFSDKMGEDMYFCERAKEMGYPIVLDADVKCRHIANLEVQEPHFEAYKAQGLTFQPHDTLDLAAMSREVRPYKLMKRHLETLL